MSTFSVETTFSPVASATFSVAVSATIPSAKAAVAGPSDAETAAAACLLASCLSSLLAASVGRTFPQSWPLLLVMVRWLLSSLSQLGTEANPALSFMGVKVEMGGETSILQLVELYHKTLQLCVKHLVQLL